MIKLFAAVSLQIPEDNTLHPLHALVPASCPQWGRILVPCLQLQHAGLQAQGLYSAGYGTEQPPLIHCDPSLAPLCMG